MATDLETGTDQGEIVAPRPSLKITGLHIRGLKSIGSLDLPGDGLGWDGPIPDMVMVGGINGSGKTTLLTFLATAFSVIGRHLISPAWGNIPSELQVSEAKIDVEFSVPKLRNMVDAPVSIVIGDTSFIRENDKGTWFGIEYNPPAQKEVGSRNFAGQEEYIQNLEFILDMRADLLESFEVPGVVYFPSERRTLISPPTNYKFAGKLLDSSKFVDRWEPPEKWDNSLEARLYGIRWEDLNANASSKENGQVREANGFEAYARAFDRFFEGRKRLKWTPKGELVVETKSGDIHDLSELSSGEKQVILFMGELLHRWRPGSLILIDEPELHLHESYQTRLWQSLVDWQKERGGQVIVATQSDHLFGISDPGIKVLLSVRRGR